jgi:FdhE protein
MVSTETPHQATQTIKDSLSRIKKDIPQLSGVVDAFQDLLINRVAAKSELPMVEFSDEKVDRLIFSQGMPMLHDRKIHVDKQAIKGVSRLLIPSMKKGFPKLNVSLSKLELFLEENGSFLDELAHCMESIATDVPANLAMKMEIPSPELQFICFELARPFAENISEKVSPFIKDLSWPKGYCPVCGSWPAISFWKSSEGRRFLRCSFCAHEWTYMRTQCPFCENTDNEKMEIIFSEDRNFEHAELCHSCMKYIVGIDTRNMIAVPDGSVAPLGLIYLDVLAQDRGFQPGAACAWNILEKTEKSF